METIITFLPKKIAEKIQHLPPNEMQDIEEIRLRINRPLELTMKGRVQFVNYLIKADDAVHLLNKISHFSMYTLEEELRRGYITIEGGHRVGLAGKVILEGGEVKAIRDISSFNIRIAKEQIGIADKLVTSLYNDSWLHTMIIGPPQTGKTTLLRDIARIISSDDRNGRFRAHKVGIIDERSEIAGSVNGIPQMTFGPRVDVLDACPKSVGMMMMIRSMSPDVLIVDEIGRKEDAEAIMEAVNAGIKLIVTIHGHSLEDIRKRPTIKPILEMEIFQRYIALNRKSGPGSVESIRDGEGKVILRGMGVT